MASLLFFGATIFGAETLQDLALALFIGMAVGAYSSIIVATPLLVWLKERQPEFAELKERSLRRRRSEADDCVAMRIEFDTSVLAAKIRDIPDFPEPGVLFKDITPLLADPTAFSSAVDAIVTSFGRGTIDKVVGIEARGFILAAPVAYHFNAGFVPLRKAGKLPHTTVSASYELEYGTATLEVHADAFEPRRPGAHRRRRAGHRRDGGGRGPAGRAGRRQRRGDGVPDRAVLPRRARPSWGTARTSACSGTSEVLAPSEALPAGGTLGHATNWHKGARRRELTA